MDSVSVRGWRVRIIFFHLNSQLWVCSGNGGFYPETFNKMKLGVPMMEFRGSGAHMCAKSDVHNRWYRVQGITKTLDSIVCCRRCAHSHNMIRMDLYARVLRDLNTGPTSTLSWVLEYVINLNGPESKAREFEGALLRLLACKSLSFESCRRAWDARRMSTSIGTAVDSQCKAVFNRKKTVSEVGPVSHLVLTQLEALRLTPICAGLKVAGVPSPDLRGNSSPRSRNCTCHNGCTKGCKSIPGRHSFYTEVDLVAHDTVINTVALMELKTRNSDVLENARLWCCNAQLWLTWTMLTYLCMAERSNAYLVIIRPGTNTVTIRNCLRPLVTKTLRNKIPWLSSLCLQMLNCLTPTCVNLRVQARSKTPGSRDEIRVDLDDLCYRNVMFNREKARISEGQFSSNKETSASAKSMQPTQLYPTARTLQS